MKYFPENYLQSNIKSLYLYLFIIKIMVHEQFTYQNLLTIFTSVANGVGNHGSFLRSFAVAYCMADSENAKILRDAAVEIILKYELYKPEYLK